MSLDVFQDYLDRLDFDFEVDSENDAIDIMTETKSGTEYAVTLIAGNRVYSLFVSPLVVPGESCDTGKLHQKLLELSEQLTYVKLSLDADGDIKIAAQGFTRLDAFGQFRRRLEALTAAIDEHGADLAALAGGDLFSGE
jgi:hypothetical protein